MSSRPRYDAPMKTGDYGFVMSRRGVLRRLTYGVCCALTGNLLLGDCSAAGEAMPFPHDWMLPKDLKLQFFDGFNRFDTKRWVPLLYNSKDNRASVNVENGRLALRALPPPMEEPMYYEATVEVNRGFSKASTAGSKTQLSRQGNQILLRTSEIHEVVVLQL